MDTSEAAVKQRMEDLSTQATNLALTSDLEKSASERVDMFFKFVEVCVYACCCYMLLYSLLSSPDHTISVYCVSLGYQEEGWCGESDG